MWSSRLLPVVTLVSIVHLVPLMTAVQSLPSYSIPESRPSAPGGNSNWHNLGKVGTYWRLPAWMFDENVNEFGADYDDEAGNVLGESGWGQQEMLDRWDDQVKRSLASKMFSRPARSRNSYQACSRRLLAILENACNGRPAKRSVNGNMMLEPANWTALAEAAKARPKRNLVEACCHNSCTKRDLMGYCFYVM